LRFAREADTGGEQGMVNTRCAFAVAMKFLCKENLTDLIVSDNQIESFESAQMKTETLTSYSKIVKTK
jgi:hypothetical protein